MILIKEINGSHLSYIDDQGLHGREYYNYCCSLISKHLSERKDKINVIMGSHPVDFKNDLKSYRIGIQYEHTLVKREGRDSESHPFGKIKSDDGFYRIRLQDYDTISKYDAIIEYSIPNIENIKTRRDLFDDYLNKVIHIYPLIYDEINLRKKPEGSGIMTMFFDTSQPRRKRLLDLFQQKNVYVNNVNGVFEKKSLQGLYDKHKIMINVRQTDHHHTFEELRVLPAIINGMLVISENVPLMETIPYNNRLIWCDYSEIINVANEVMENYPYYTEKIFLNFRSQFDEMVSKNLENIERLNYILS